MSSFEAGLALGAIGTAFIAHYIHRTSIRHVKWQMAQQFVTLWVPRVANGLDPKDGPEAAAFYDRIHRLIDSVQEQAFREENFRMRLKLAQFSYAAWQKARGNNDPEEMLQDQLAQKYGYAAFQRLRQGD